MRACRADELRSCKNSSPQQMGFTLTALVEAMLLFVNAVAVLNEERFLRRVGWARTTDPALGDAPAGVRAKLLQVVHAIRLVARSTSRCCCGFIACTNIGIFLTALP